MTDPKEIFSGGRLLARQRAPYMRAILLGLSPVESPGLGTIGVTEHGVLLIDWEFIEKLGNTASDPVARTLLATEEMAGLLIHECMHLLLKHMQRCRSTGRDPAIHNVAGDLAINPSIQDMGFKLPTGGGLDGMYPEQFGWDRGLTADEYYHRLQKLRPPQARGAGGQGQEQGQGAPQAGQGAGGQGGTPQAGQNPGQGAGQGQQKGQGKGGSKSPPPMPDRPKAGGGWCGTCAGHGVPNEPDGGHKASRSPAQLERLGRQVAEAVREHAQRGRGTVPAGLQRWAEELLKPPVVPWQQELAMVTRQACAWRENACDHRYDAPSRRQAGIGYGAGKPILPRFRMPVPNVAVILDTSGSMGSGELNDAVSEIQGILKAVGANVTFCVCDAAVHGVGKVRTAKEAVAALKGGGGTDMRPAFEALMRERPRPEVIVCMTDLQIGDPGPQPTGVKVIWVGVGPYQGGDPPWGRVVRINKDNSQAAWRR